MNPISNMNSILVFAREISDLNMLLAKLINVNHKTKLPVQVEWDVSARQLETSASMLHRLLSLKKDYFPQIDVSINVLPSLSANGNVGLIKDYLATFQDSGVSITLGRINVSDVIQHVIQRKGSVWVLVQNPAHVKLCKDAVDVLKGEAKVYLN